jgi:retron-type reverse transcriptase
MKIQFNKTYEDIISLDNLLLAWQEFVCGKRKKKDVQLFEKELMMNLNNLHKDLAARIYRHSNYIAFNISDPKPRNIHKAVVRDRVLHHAIYRQMYPFFDRTFVADSYSCRNGKGLHKALNCFREFGRKVSKNNTRTVWVLKCDIKRFFASINHKMLLGILDSYIPDKNVLWLLKKVIESFKTQPLPNPPLRRGGSSTGLPLGNLTSQLFCNVYMNEFDQFVKHKLKAKHYIRYADDFIFLSDNKDYLVGLVSKISIFLDERLKLSLHPDKVFIKTLASGADFLGWVNFPSHRVLRNVTKRRMFKSIRMRPKNETLQSYLGLIRHGNTFGLKQEVLDWYGLFANKITD